MDLPTLSTLTDHSSRISQNAPAIRAWCRLCRVCHDIAVATSVATDPPSRPLLPLVDASYLARLHIITSRIEEMQNIGDHDALSEIRYSAILGSLLCSPGSKPWESYEAHWRQQFPWLACELKRTEGEGREPCRVLVKGEEMMMCSRVSFHFLPPFQLPLSF